jgi:hypothetical protein
MPQSTAAPVARLLPRKRVLVVNCYFDYSRQPIRRPTKFPQAVGPIYLAGAFAREACDVRCYDEVSSGPLESEELLAVDMLVLTGLTHCLDRMLHLTACARTKNPRVIVVAGGPAVRALPLLSEQFFDYSCLGDTRTACSCSKISCALPTRRFLLVGMGSGLLRAQVPRLAWSDLGGSRSAGKGEIRSD